MGYSLGGFQSGITSIVNIIAGLIGQDIKARSFEATGGIGAGNVAFKIDTAGNRLSFSSTGTGDYLSSDGNSTITTPGTIASSLASQGAFQAPANAGTVYAFVGVPASGMGNSSGAPFLAYAGNSTCGIDPTSSRWYSTAGYQVGGSGAPLLISPNSPTISSGFGTTPSVVAANGTAAFQVNVGTGGTASTGVLALPTAAHGWVLHCVDTTSPTTAYTVQTASTANSASLASFSRATGLSTPWASGAVINVMALAF